MQWFLVRYDKVLITCKGEELQVEIYRKIAILGEHQKVIGSAEIHSPYYANG